MTDTYTDVKGDILNNYLNEHWLARPKSNGDLEWVYLGNGITQVDFKPTDKKKTAAYYDGGGSENTTVTGVTFSLDVTGDRAIGNTAQDVIADMDSETGKARIVNFRRIEYILNDDGKLEATRAYDGLATVSDIQAGGGAADDNGSFKCTITYNSKPKVIKASENPTELDALQTENPSQNKEILNVDLVPSTGTDPNL
jgi:hypothetical protein